MSEEWTEYDALEADYAIINDQVDELKAKLHEVREIYVGMDGMGFLTAKESYLMRIIKQMYEAAAGNK
jgi:hypothetical protein